MVNGILVFTRNTENQECHCIPLYPRWHPYPLLRYVNITSRSRQATIKALIGQEQGYTGGNDPANREA